MNGNIFMNLVYHSGHDSNKGFQLEKSDATVRVYFVDMNRIIEVDSVHVSDFHALSEEALEDRGTFVTIDGDIGIIHRLLDDGTAFCFMPKIKNLVRTKEWMPLITTI